MPRPREFNREQVLLDAMFLFRDQGYEATSVQDLVERMRINRFSLYATFKSKHDLFVEALEAYYTHVAVPFFDRLRDSGEGLAVIESVLLELVTRITRGVSPNGCLLSNSLAEVGARGDERTARVFTRYLKRVEANFKAAVEKAREMGEVAADVDTEGQARMLVAFATGLLSMSKVTSERDMRRAVRAAVAGIG